MDPGLSEPDARRKTGLFPEVAGGNVLSFSLQSVGNKKRKEKKRINVEKRGEKAGRYLCGAAFSYFFKKI